MKRILFSLMAIVLSLGLMGGAFAYFSDTEESASNTFASGTLLLDVNANNSVGTFSFTLGDISNIAPGDVTGSASIIVKNAGTIDAATFGRFTLTNDTGLAKVLKFYNYKAEYYKADGGQVARWDTTDPYFGTAINMDWFIKDGDTSKFTAVGGLDNLRDWVDTDGPLDIYTTAWDMEGLKPEGYYVLSFQFQMDPAADNAYQAESVTLGYEVRATQINKEAIVALGIGGYIDDWLVTYLQDQCLLQ